ERPRGGLGRRPVAREDGPRRRRGRGPRDRQRRRHPLRHERAQDPRGERARRARPVRRPRRAEGVRDRPRVTLKAAIVGGTGYGGMELLRYLLDHPGVEVSAITSRTETGAVADAHPHLRGLTALKFTAERAADLAKACDVLFFATPNGVAAKEVPAV